MRIPPWRAARALERTPWQPACQMTETGMHRREVKLNEVPATKDQWAGYRLVGYRWRDDLPSLPIAPTSARAAAVQS